MDQKSSGRSLAPARIFQTQTFFDLSGNVISSRKYDAYGLVRSSTGPSGTKHKWVGALGHPSEDETGLVYMRARYMDPALGRFVSEDPERDGLKIAPVDHLT